MPSPPSRTCVLRMRDEACGRKAPSSLAALSCFPPAGLRASLLRVNGTMLERTILLHFLGPSPAPR